MNLKDPIRHVQGPLIYLPTCSSTLLIDIIGVRSIVTGRSLGVSAASTPIQEHNVQEPADPDSFN
jgi:hypothetical protein